MGAEEALVCMLQTQPTSPDGLQKEETGSFHVLCSPFPVPRVPAPGRQGPMTHPSFRHRPRKSPWRGGGSKNLQGKCLALISAVSQPRLGCCCMLITVLIVAVVGLSVALSERKPEAVIMSPVYSACQKNWIGFDGKCFYFSEEQRNWTHSQASCMALGAELACFKNLEELKFLMRYKGASAHWIGLSRESSGQPWKWTDGTEYNMMDVHGEGTRAYLSSDRISSSRDGPPRNWICHKPSSSDLQCLKLSPSA